MVDTLTPEQRSERMSRIRGANTKPELKVRRLLHRCGYRFRLHRKDLPGRPDIVLPRHRAVIFVHGCFWHRHPDPTCRRARMPRTRREFWEAKLQGNRERDVRDQRALAEAGWRVLVVWECELGDNEQLENEIRAWLGEGRCRR